MSLKYKKGDVTEPCIEGHVFVLHAVSTKDKWGPNTLTAKIFYEFPEVKSTFIKSRNRKIGDVQHTDVEGDVTITNVICYRHPTAKTIPPIRYDPLEMALIKVAEEAEEVRSAIQLERIGCDEFGGGEWDKIEPMIQKLMIRFPSIDWIVFDPKPPKKKKKKKKKPKTVVVEEGSDEEDEPDEENEHDSLPQGSENTHQPVEAC